MTDVRIRDIRIEPNSCDANCYPKQENQWQIDFPIVNPGRIGIGYIVEPESFVNAWPAKPFALHDHQYTSAYMPVERRAQVIYHFSRDTAIRDLLVVQHTNGITQVEGFVGPAQAGPWTSLGLAQSRLVGLATGPSMFVEGARDVFEFPNWARSASYLRIIIRRTSLNDGYATFRIYPRNAQRDPLTVASSDVLATTTGRVVIEPEAGPDESRAAHQ